jgi:hypothetical protein
MRISVEGASRVGEGAWKVKLTSQDTRVFGEAPYRHGAWTVVALDQEPEFDGDSRELSFDPGAARLLNLGSADQALVLAPLAGIAGARQERRPAARAATTVSGARGDRVFLAELTEGTRALGERFLSEARKLIPGELNRTPSGKFVETPDNFWTVRIQPRDKSLRFTVRGKITDFRVPKSIQLSHDRGIYYSAFKIGRIEQVEDAIEILLQADELRKRKSGG